MKGLLCFWGEGSFDWMALVDVPSTSMPSLGIGDAERFDPCDRAVLGREFGCFWGSLASGTVPGGEGGICRSSWPMGTPSLVWDVNL